MKSAYIHIPFCDTICSYCDFCKLLNNSNIVDKYLNELEKEIEKNYKKEKLNTIYIGGGTPSCLSLKQLEKLFNIINIFDKSELKEFSIECNFESTTKEKLDLFKKYGINRISYGLESINDNELKFLNRKADQEHIKKIINYSKEIGINNINIDLIYALPNQKIENIKESLDFITCLDITHISTYSLMIENNTILKINNVKNISEDDDYTMYKYICNYLKQHNFIHYEISNFAKKGYYSIHNDTYWKNNRYYGFGLGASGYIDNERYTNTRSITNYLKGKYKYSSEILSVYDDMGYQIILNLRRKYGINKKVFKKKFNIDIKKCYNYSSLVKEKFLIEDDNFIYIPEYKWYISNEIIVRFLEGVLYE